MKKSLISISLLTTSLSVNADVIDGGLKKLFENVNCQQEQYCYNLKNQAKIKAQALGFKSEFDAIIKKYENVPSDLQWNYKPSDLNKKQFSFTSYYQRIPGHASNVVRGVYYTSPSQDYCQTKMPATLLIHKISNEISAEERIAKMSAQQNRGSVMIIFLPEYGPRQQPGENFITADPAKYRENLMQALLDIHQAYKILSAQPEVDSKNIGLAGFSLGGMITLISASIDPVFDRYLTVVGGGDLARVMSYKYRHPEDKDSETAQALKDVTFSEDEARFFMSQFDAITFAQQPENKKITMINALQDELLDKDQSIEKLFNIYKIKNPESKLITYDGGHVVDFFKIGIMKSMKSIVNPLFDFMSEGLDPIPQCDNYKNMRR